MLRPMFVLYIALAVMVAGVLSFTQFPSQAGPSYDAEWDLPGLKSAQTLHLYGMDGPMNYRGWPHEFDSYVPQQTSRVRAARVVQAARVTQARKQELIPATLTIGRVVMSVVCRYVGAGNVLCHKNGVV